MDVTAEVQARIQRGFLCSTYKGHIHTAEAGALPLAWPTQCIGSEPHHISHCADSRLLTTFLAFVRHTCIMCLLDNPHLRWVLCYQGTTKHKPSGSLLIRICTMCRSH